MEGVVGGSGWVGLHLSGVSAGKSSLLSLELLGPGRGSPSRASRAQTSEV